MKKLIAALVATLSLLVGGLAVSAPAQAVNGSTVWYTHSINPNLRLNTWTTGGTLYFQAWNTQIANVQRTCPQSSSYRLSYTAPNGGTGTLGYGTCLVPSQVGTYRVRLIG